MSAGVGLSDRRGITGAQRGLSTPAFLAGGASRPSLRAPACVQAEVGVGKTVVSSAAAIDRAVAPSGTTVARGTVGFEVVLHRRPAPGARLRAGEGADVGLAHAGGHGEHRPRRIALGLLAAETAANARRDQVQAHRDLAHLGEPTYRRVDALRDAEALSSSASPRPNSTRPMLAGDPVTDRLAGARAAGRRRSGAQGGHGERVVRGAPRGRGRPAQAPRRRLERRHVRRLQDEARALVDGVFRAGGVG